MAAMRNALNSSPWFVLGKSVDCHMHTAWSGTPHAAATPCHKPAEPSPGQSPWVTRAPLPSRPPRCRSQPQPASGLGSCSASQP
ncbi:hypothetical protein HaLaN_22902 [Haematococcus lacustris]|uniref:Uncharacterized protein n=1 Tax=Haematococcus lacustris TaxID=44745 RepID=A0A6A0A440_HAELA|nr:hypothetical protein HaLaN_22902 [Haematococcus lacustris]